MLDKLVMLSAVSSGVACSRPFIAGWDDSSLSASYSSGQEFRRIPGDLEISDYSIRALYPEPIFEAYSIFIQPAFDYRSTALHFDKVPTSVFVAPENLKSFDVEPYVVTISALVGSFRLDSPWMFGAWVEAGLASDFQDLRSHDFKFDFAAGGGYRFSESLSVGLGAAFTDLPGETGVRPGIGLDWKIDERFRVAICGPVCAVTYALTPDWQFSLQGDSTGEIWNVSDNRDRSRYLQLTSYKVGLFANRRITDHIQLAAGVGVTFSNEIELFRSNGTRVVDQRLDQGFFGQIGLIIAAW